MRRWFGSVNLSAQVLPVAEAIIDEVVNMLDVLDPQLVDRGRSSIGSRGQTPGGRVFTLEIAHVSDPQATVYVEVDGGGAVVSWLGTHEHVGMDEGSVSRPWTSIVVDVLAAALRGEYEVESLHRGGRLVRTRVRDKARDGAVVSETGSVLGWLPLGRSSTETERLDFGIRR